MTILFKGLKERKFLNSFGTFWFQGY